MQRGYFVDRFLVVDVGTEGAKSAIIDDYGKIVCEASQNYDLRCPKPGWQNRTLMTGGMLH